MTNLDLKLDRSLHKLGEDVTGELEFFARENYKARDILVTLSGAEKTEIKRTRSTGKTTTTHTYREYNEQISKTISLKEEFQKLSGVSLDKDVLRISKGKYTVPFYFLNIDDGLMPSYFGKSARVEYELSSKIDVPWGFDFNAYSSVVILNNEFENSESEKEKTEKISKKSFLPQAIAPDVAVYMTIEDTVLSRGERIKGNFEIHNRSGKEIRGIDLYLIANEYAQAEGYEDFHETEKFTSRVNIIAEDSRQIFQRFDVKVPMAVSPTRKGKYFELNWNLRANLDIKFASDVDLNQEIIVK